MYRNLRTREVVRRQSLIPIWRLPMFAVVREQTIVILVICAITVLLSITPIAKRAVNGIGWNIVGLAAGCRIWLSPSSRRLVAHFSKLLHRMMAKLLCGTG